MNNERDPILANAKFGELQMGYASFDEQGRGIRIAAFTEKPDLHISFALPIDQAEILAKEILERSAARRESQAKYAKKA